MRFSTNSKLVHLVVKQDSLPQRQLACVRIPVTSEKSPVVDKLLTAAAPKVTVATPVDSLATRFDSKAYRRRRRHMVAVPRTTVH